VAIRLKPRHAQTSAWRVVGTNAVAKVLVMAASGVLAFITTRLIIQHFGIAAYAQYGLLASLTSLVPFADLGMSAVIINTIAGSTAPQTDPLIQRTMISAFRTLLGSALALIFIGLLTTLLGWWPAVLGHGLEPGASTSVLVCVMVFALTLPLGVGQRILTGLGKNHVQIVTQGLAAPFILLTVVIVVISGSKVGNFLAVASYVSGTVVAGVALLVAAKYIKPQVRSAIAAVPKVRTVPGVKTLNVAWPMLVQMIALPIAMQTDRLLLSHLGTTRELAQYNLASQLFGLIIQTMSAAGFALWPIFAKARSVAEIKSPKTLTVGFLIGGFGLAGALALALPWITPIITGGEISVSPWLAIGFVIFVTAQAVKYPVGMYMTDSRGIRFQLLPILIMVPINLGISWLLIAPLGAAGPIVGSAISVTVCQVVPNLLYVRRDLASRRAERTAGLPAVPTTG
jgi:O-antigen/teichoic acid export membrane protein